MVRHSFTNFMIIDSYNNHYNVNNSVWFWKWDSVEDYAKIKVGDTITSYCYGWRIPFLSVFPNIVGSKLHVKY